jgi:hypothetical protein
VANGRAERSIASATLASVPALSPAAMRGHVMPSFTNSLIGLGPFVDTGHTVVFAATGVSVIRPDGHSILDGWREAAGPRLWRFPLTPTQEKPEEVHDTRNVAFERPHPEDTQEDSPEPPTNSKNRQVQFLPKVDKYISTESGLGNQEPATPTPSAKRPCKRKPKRRRRTTPLVTEPITPPPPATTPPTLNVSDQHFEAVDNHGQACYVTYMYGANQAMAMAVETTKTGKPFDPRSIDLPSIGALVGFYHACAGFPVKHTWLKAIKAGNYNFSASHRPTRARNFCERTRNLSASHRPTRHGYDRREEWLVS